MLKTYSNKSNARRAARKQFENDDMFTLIQDAAGKWSFIEAEVEAEVQAIEEPVVGDYSHCPKCGVHLSNGVSDYEIQRDIAVRNKAPEAAIKKEFLCLGCAEEFGETVKISSAKTAAPTGKGLKIQKDREERNGLKRPSAGGKCAAVWEKCEEIYNVNGMVPTPKTLKEWCVENDHNFNNASIELYRWRTWMGFKGRK